jgi:hypothetical protein
MRRVATLVLALALAPIAATAQTAKEKFIVPPYPGETPWKPHIVARPPGEMVWVEWWPENQPENDVKDILTEQIIFAAKNVKPIAFVTSMFARINQRCTGVSVNGPKEQTENGYPVAYGQVYCVGQKGAGQDVDIFVKVIGGNDALYVVQREFRRPATAGQHRVPACSAAATQRPNRKRT